MEPALGASKAEIYGAATFGLAVGSVAAYPVGAAIDRGRGRVVLSFGSAAAALLLFMWSRVTSVAWFYAVFAGIGFAQAMTLYDAIFAVVVREAIGDPRATITALTLWGGFASTVFVPVTQALLDTFAWRGALVALAALNLLVCLPIHLAVPAASAAVRPRSTTEGSWRSASVRRAAADPVFLLLGLSFTLYYAAFSALTYHLYPLLLERGFAPRTVAAAIALVGPAQVAGRVLVWWLARDRPIRAIGMATVAGLPASVLVLVALPSTVASLVLFALVYGLANGVMTIVRGLAVPEMVTKEAYGVLNGILGVPSAVARAGGPVAAAALWSTRRSYDPVVDATFLGALLCAASYWLASLRAAER